jgi:1-acyl-sn-glycerol-3-phosphate acyltransferase
VRLHYRLSWLFLNCMERLVFGFKVTGAEHIPRNGPVIIASNHISYGDPPVVGSAVPREVHFMAKEELFANRAFGWLIRRYNAIALKRAVGDLGAVRRAVDLLKQGRAVLMFPEGTRSLTGNLLKAKPGVGLIACAAGVPVVPAHVSGTNCLWQVFLRRAGLKVAFGPPFTAAALPEAGTSGRDKYQALSDEVMRRIAELADRTGRNER